MVASKVSVEGFHCRVDVSTSSGRHFSGRDNCLLSLGVEDACWVECGGTGSKEHEPRLTIAKVENTKLVKFTVPTPS